MELLDLVSAGDLPSWFPLVLAVGLLVILGLLYLAMRHSISRIRVVDDTAETTDTSGADQSE